MNLFGISLLNDAPPKSMPFWRQIFRGFSQCAFQVNELTGLLFVAAVASFSWRMAALYVISVVIGTLAARLLRADPEMLGLGLFGFNSGLMGLALGNFFVLSPAVWIWASPLAALIAVVALLMARWVPLPFLAAPFIAIFWLIWPFTEPMGLQRIDFGAFPDLPVVYPVAMISALGSALFAPALLAGALFLLGVLASNWRHAIVALMAAAIAALMADYVNAAGAMINSGFVGFNAVLAALGTFALVAPDLRLAALAAMLGTWVVSVFFRHWPAPALAVGFVLAVWLIIGLGWLNIRFVPGSSKDR